MEDTDEKHHPVIKQFLNFWFPEGKWELEAWNNDGISGATVVPIKVMRAGQGSHGKGGEYFIKIYRPDSRGKKEETQRLSEAINVTIQIDKDFAENHIIKEELSHEIKFNDKNFYCLLFPVAGSSHRYFKPANGVRNKNFVKNASSIICKLMNAWTQKELDQTAILPHQFLEKWLGYRLDAEKAVEFHQFVKENIGEEPIFLFNGGRLSNPLKFYKYLETKSSNLQSIYPLVGVLHRDLHGGNLFLDVHVSEKQ